MKVDVIYNKSCQRMNELPDGSIDMLMTSPPYWGLRDYGEDVKEIWGGDPDCEHNWETVIKHRTAGGPQVPQSKWKNNKAIAEAQRDTKSDFCSKCGAWYGQLGLEPTFQLYLDHMMIVCAEIKRVLKKIGSFWLNMGDTYSATRWSNTPSTTGKSGPASDVVLQKDISLPNKCLLGIPSRLRNRLIDEQDWTCRNTVIWAKPNSMPSSKKDGLTPSYEFLFHFVKNTKPQYHWNEKTALMADRKPSKIQEIEDIDWEWRECSRCMGKGRIEEKICPRCKGTGKIKHSFWHSLGYWYDLDAIRESYTEPLNRWGGNKIKVPGKTKWKNLKERAKWSASALEKKSRPYSAGKNPGDVWHIPTQPRPEAHFATFPDKLCIKPILATCPLEICKKCGKARVRIKEKPLYGIGDTKTKATENGQPNIKHLAERRQFYRSLGYESPPTPETIGWTDCGCNAGWDSGVLLDPFGGRGTSAVMAKKMGRHYIVYELKKEYCEKLIKPALEEIDPLFNWKTPGLQAREKK